MWEGPLCPDIMWSKAKAVGAPRPLPHFQIRRKLTCHHSGDSSFELLQLHRFHQMLGKAGLEAFADIAFHAEAADRDAADGSLGAQVTDKLHPIAIRQTDIADEEVKGFASRDLERTPHAVSGSDAVAAQREQSFQSGACVRMIVNQQDAKTGGRYLGLWHARFGGSFVEIHSFHRQQKGGATARALAL